MSNFETLKLKSENGSLTQTEADILKQTNCIYNGENENHSVSPLTIISPTTEESLKYWSKNTNWFNNQALPIDPNKLPVILFLPTNANGDGDKLLLSQDGDKINFVNQNGEPVSKDYMEKHWDVLEPFANWLQDINLFPEKYISSDLRTKYYTDMIHNNNGNVLFFIPDEYKTEELCKLAVAKNPSAIKFVPEKYLTDDVLQTAIKHDASIIKLIPNDLKTPDFYNMAFKTNINCKQYIPDECLTPEIKEISEMISLAYNDEKQGLQIISVIPLKETISPELGRSVYAKLSDFFSIDMLNAFPGENNLWESSNESPIFFITMPDNQKILMWRSEFSNNTLFTDEKRKIILKKIGIY